MEGVGGLGCEGHSFPLDLHRAHVVLQNQKFGRGKWWVSHGEKEVRTAGF